jgi:hypothetical protein
LSLLGRFIQTYGTHIVVGMAVGGQDVICVKQKHSSKIPPGDIRRHLEDLGDLLFSDVRSPSSLHRKTADSKQKVLCFIFCNCNLTMYFLFLLSADAISLFM